MSSVANQEVGPLTGRSLGDFVVETKLGEGGFGEVYLAAQPVLAREAVIKTLRWGGGANAELVQRFLREARVASSLDHPFAAHVYAFGAEPDGTLWIAMERVNGSTLSELIAAGGPLPVSRLLPLIERICEVVHTAHEHGIVHRDLKPANIMVVSRAGRLLPKLLDFGIARALAAEPVEHVVGGGGGDFATGSLAQVLTRAGIEHSGAVIETGRALIGTPAYMAPEQWVDPHKADRRADIYALGAVVYEALTGQRAFAGDSVMAIARAHARQPPPKLPDGFPPGLDAVIATALAKVAADRYPTALEFAAALRAASGEPIDDAQLPALSDDLRDAVLTAAPQPIADAVAAYEAAITPDRAARAAEAIVITAVRYLAVVAVCARSRTGGIPDTPEVRALLGRWRDHGLAVAEWIELARLMTAEFVARPDVFPIPELPRAVALDPARSSALAELAGIDAGGGAEPALAELVGRVERMLAELRFLSDYPLVATLDGGARSWMGARRRRRAAARIAAGIALPPGEPVLLDGAGAPLVELFPVVQIAAPSPGAEDELFVLERGHHLGAVLVAHPIGFERHDDRAWSVFPMLAHADAIGPGTSGGRMPYRGLESFSADDADWFFGREQETEAFTNLLRERAFVAVVGPSGVGKSSFVKAGVLPRLVDPLPIVFRPGDRPLAAAAAALTAALGRDVTAAELAAPDALRRLAIAHAADRGMVVIVVDQFEELVTLCRDRAEREQFGALLVAAGDSADAPVRVIVTLRDDFLVRAEEVPTLHHRLGPNLHVLTTPAAADLIRIVVEPARKAGYGFDDPDLPARIVEQVEARPGALALLSFTALRLWELRDERYRQLKKASYESMGGVGGALARHAETTLAELPDADRPLVREVFRHLVTADGTRAVMSKVELAEVLGGGARADAVIQSLIAARLLTSSDDASGDDRVEVVHEALLSAWPRLVDWRREDAETARLRDQLRAAARQWDDRGRARDMLWRGETLTELSLWRGRYPGKLTEREEAFSAASLADAARGRRIRRTLLGTALAVLAAASAVLFVMYRSSQADRRAAEHARGDARQRVVDLLFEQGRAAAVAGRPMEALVYLDAAHERGASGPALEHLVAGAVETIGLERARFTHASRVTAVAFDHDGTRVATAGGFFDKTVKVWDVATGAARGEITDLAGGASTVAFTGDGALVVSAPPRFLAWDVGTRAVRFDVGEAADAGRGSAAVTPDGARILAIVFGTPARLLDAHTGAVVRELDSGPVISGVMSPSGQSIAIVNTAGELVVFGPTGDERVRFAAGGNPWPLVVSPDDRYIVGVINTESARVMVWDRTGKVITAITGHRRGVYGLEISADSSELLTASDDSTAKLWKLATGQLVRSFEGHAGPVVIARFDPTGRHVVTASTDGTAKLWLRDSATEIATYHGHTDQLLDAVFSPDGTTIATASTDKTARLWTVGIPGLVAQHDYVAGGTGSITRFADGSVFAIGPTTPPTLFAADGAAGTALAAPDPLPPFVESEVPYMETRRIASLAPDGSTIAAPIGAATVVWNRASGAIVGTCAGHDAPVLFARHSRDGRYVVWGDEHGAVELCDVATFRSKPLGNHRFAVVDADVDPTGTGVVSAGYDKRVVVWTAAGGVERELVGHTNGVTVARFSADGRRIVTGSLDTTVRVWDRATGQQVIVLQTPSQVMSAAIGDAVVAAAVEDGRVFLWETTSWRLVRVVGVRDGPVEWIELVGDELITGDASGRMRRWRIRRAERLDHLHDYVRCNVPFELADNKPALRPLAPDPTCAGVDATVVFDR